MSRSKSVWWRHGRDILPGPRRPEPVPPSTTLTGFMERSPTSAGNPNGSTPPASRGEVFVGTGAKVSCGYGDLTRINSASFSTASRCMVGSTEA